MKNPSSTTLLFAVTCFVLLISSSSATARGGSALAYEEGCGTEHLNQTCGEPYPCCSTYGHCGNTEYYCLYPHCDPSFGTCWDHAPPPPPTPSNPPTPPPSVAPSPSEPEEGCGPEHHEQSCGDPYPCCSKEGHCGDSVYYCAPGNCLPKYGICWGNVPPPPPPEANTLIGKVIGGMELLNKY